MHHFTPESALAGGILIGLAASLLLIANGSLAGVSGILGGLVMPRPGDVAWRAWFLAGLVGAGLAAMAIAPETIGTSSSSVGGLAIAGLLVGVGTRLGRGCTSGHGVCGISRFSLRSLIATATFVATGIATVAALRVLGATP